MRNSWYKSISANITMRWISMRNLTLFDYAFVRNHMHCSVITIRSISMCISTLSNFPWVKNSYVLHYALFSYHYAKYQYVHRGTVWFSIGEELLCASLCTFSVITIRSISMCIVALSDFPWVRNSYVLYMHYFSYHYEKYQYVHICTIWFSICEEFVYA